MPQMPPAHRNERPALGDGRPSAARRGYDAHWRRLRLTVLAKRPVCEDCKREAAVDVDHRVALARGGTNDEGNLVALCHSCHSRKTVAVDGGFGRERRG